jgi:hypothetical protein
MGQLILGDFSAASAAPTISKMQVNADGTGAPAAFVSGPVHAGCRTRYPRTHTRLLGPHGRRLATHRAAPFWHQMRGWFEWRPLCGIHRCGRWYWKLYRGPTSRVNCVLMAFLWSNLRKSTFYYELTPNPVRCASEFRLQEYDKQTSRGCFRDKIIYVPLSIHEVSPFPHF